MVYRLYMVYQYGEVSQIQIRKKSTRVCRTPWLHAMAIQILEMASAYGLRLPLWLLTKPKFPRPLIKFLSFPFSVDFIYFSFLYSLVSSSYAQKLRGHVTLKNLSATFHITRPPSHADISWRDSLITNSPRLTICCDMYKPNSTCSN